VTIVANAGVAVGTGTAATAGWAFLTAGLRAGLAAGFVTGLAAGARWAAEDLRDCADLAAADFVAGAGDLAGLVDFFI
jgi:hypothetical protein